MRPVNEKKIKEVLDFIREYQVTEGKTPTFRQIMKHCKIASLNTVANYVARLEERGFIELTTENGWRQIRLPDYLRPSESHPSYIVGAVHCGPPTEAVECIEACVSLPDEIFGDGEHTLLRAEGPSMINRGIFDGDLLVIRRTPTAEYGQTIIAMLESGESTCKVLDRKDNKNYLRAANDEMLNGKRKYDVYPKGEWSIYGVVDFVIHKPTNDVF